MVSPSKRKRGPSGETRERVFEFVRHALERGAPPTVREVQAEFGFRAVQTAREHLERLVADGRLAKASGVARGYRLPEAEARASRWVPLVGRVAAGALTEAIQTPEGHVPVSLARSLSRSKASGAAPNELFALRVRGESMIELGILDGDLVIVRRGAEARDGDVVVAQIDGEATVKTLRRRNGRVELHPANASFRPIVVDPSAELTLLGKVIEVRRFLEPGRELGGA